MADTEVTIVARFQWGREPTEDEVRQAIEDQWLGVMLSYEQEDV